MMGSHTCTGCQQELMGYLIGPEVITTCPHCGAPLDPQSIAMARMSVQLVVFGGLPLMFGAGAGLAVHFLLFPGRENFIPGMISGVSVWLLSLSGLILFYTGPKRMKYLLGLLIGVALAAVGVGIAYFVWG